MRLIKGKYRLKFHSSRPQQHTDWAGMLRDYNLRLLKVEGNTATVEGEDREVRRLYSKSCGTLGFCRTAA